MTPPTSSPTMHIHSVAHSVHPISWSPVGRTATVVSHTLLNNRQRSKLNSVIPHISQLLHQWDHCPHRCNPVWCWWVSYLRRTSRWKGCFRVLHHTKVGHPFQFVFCVRALRRSWTYPGRTFIIYSRRWSRSVSDELCTLYPYPSKSDSPHSHIKLIASTLDLIYQLISCTSHSMW